MPLIKKKKKRKKRRKRKKEEKKKKRKGREEKETELIEARQWWTRGEKFLDQNFLYIQKYKWGVFSICHCCFRQLTICKCFNCKILLTVRLPGVLPSSQLLFWYLKEEDREVRIAGLAWEFGIAPLEWDRIIESQWLVIIRLLFWGYSKIGQWGARELPL